MSPEDRTFAILAVSASALLLWKRLSDV